jgi:hypothetical protein
MTEFNPLKWREIWEQLNDGTELVSCYELTSILEDLYVENQELKSRVETLEKDMEFGKRYGIWKKIWNFMSKNKMTDTYYWK